MSMHAFPHLDNNASNLHNEPNCRRTAYILPSSDHVSTFSKSSSSTSPSSTMIQSALASACSSCAFPEPVSTAFSVATVTGDPIDFALIQSVHAIHASSSSGKSPNVAT